MSSGLTTSDPACQGPRLQPQRKGRVGSAWLGGTGSSLEPDLNFVAIRIGDVGVGEAGGELAATEQAPSGAFDLGDGTVDVAGVHEPETEMCDASAETGGRGVLGARGDVGPPSKLSIGEA